MGPVSRRHVNEMNFGFGSIIGEETVVQVRIQDALGCRNISRVGHYGPPDGWQMRHASPFIFGITQLAVQFRWRGPCAQLASRLG
jgi:hypothetical protein